MAAIVSARTGAPANVISPQMPHMGYNRAHDESHESEPRVLRGHRDPVAPYRSVPAHGLLSPSAPRRRLAGSARGWRRVDTLSVSSARSVVGSWRGGSAF